MLFFFFFFFKAMLCWLVLFVVRPCDIQLVVCYATALNRHETGNNNAEHAFKTGSGGRSHKTIRGTDNISCRSLITVDDSFKYNSAG